MSTLEGPSPPTPPNSTRRRIWQAALVFVGAALLLTPILFILRIATAPLPGSGRPQIGERTLSDGSLLVLEQITTESPHQFTHKLPKKGVFSKWFDHSPRPSSASHTFNANAMNGAMVAWFTHWDATRQKPMDFDWWLTSVLVDENGEEIEDANPCYYSWDGSGSTMMSSDRPWSQRSGTGPAEKVIVASSGFPILRPSAAPRRLRVYDRAGTLVAEFDLPPINPRPIPDWTPEPLPTSKTDQAVTVTFNDVSITAKPEPKSSPVRLSNRRPKWEIRPKVSVTRNGVIAPEWQQKQIRISDPLGNEADGMDCGLSFREPAWKLQLKFVRKSPIGFLPEEQFSSGLLPLPPNDSSQPLQVSAIVQGIELTLSAIGRGAVTYEMTGSLAHNAHHWQDANSLGEKSYTFSRSGRSTSRGGVVLTAITGDLVHLVLNFANLPPEHHDLLQIHDEQERELPYRLNRLTSGNEARYFLFVDPPPDARSIGLTVFVDTARTFELMIAPPKP